MFFFFSHNRRPPRSKRTDTRFPYTTLFRSLFAIPISKLSDAKNRVVIFSSAIVVWSAFTAFGGLAKNFVTFGFSRIGVALGEAALTPDRKSTRLNSSH